MYYTHKNLLVWFVVVCLFNLVSVFSSSSVICCEVFVWNLSYAQLWLLLCPKYLHFLWDVFFFVLLIYTYYYSLHSQDTKLVDKIYHVLTVYTMYTYIYIITPKSLWISLKMIFKWLLVFGGHHFFNISAKIWIPS